MTLASVFQQRRSGILLHISSLPAGNLGADAYRFVDFLNASGVTVWQTLPLGPTHGDLSPYQCLSAHAGNNKFICLETVKSQDWADASQLSGNEVSEVIPKAYKQFLSNASDDSKAEFYKFCEQQKFWLDDYVLFCELRALNQYQAWFDWPKPLRDREINALERVKIERHESLMARFFEQFLFYKQWRNLCRYAQDKNVKLFGDMPIFVAHDSADVWAEPELFTLNEAGQSTRVAGVPPDYFSATGQRWGNPLYEWSEHIATDFDWWHRRLKTQLECFDLIRIDHFRGFEACWEIPADCETAIEGQWKKAPGVELFDSLTEKFGALPLVAEDLGIITDEVTALRKQYNMPGMKILQFAFGGDSTNPYLPHQHYPETVVYTGTHDNDTTMGWYESMDHHTKQHLYEYLGNPCEDMAWMLIRCAYRSVSNLVIIPLQDILSLNGEHRMNVPGSIKGNWAWKLNWDMFHPDIAEKLRGFNSLFGRNGS